MADDAALAEAGRQLLLKVGLGDAPEAQRYAPVNAIYKHASTDAVLYVGNARFASSKKDLDEHKITRVVCCQGDSEGKLHFQDDPSMKYLHYKIGQWRDALPRYLNEDPKKVNAYFAPLFDFVNESLDAGESVLIHCLAGAHRAGTAGVACLMTLCDLDRHEGLEAAKTSRPAINPIGDFPLLLQMLENALKAK